MTAVVARGRGQAFVLTASLLLCLSACSTPEKDPTVPSKEPLTKTAPLLEAAQNIIGGDWRVEDTGLQECLLGDGRVGDAWAALRLGPGLPKEAQNIVLDKITAAWSEAGYEPAIGTLPVIDGVEVAQLRYPAAGRGPDGLYLEVQVATTGSTLESVASCTARAAKPEGEESP